jgi:tetratricopeptide (TPR) repeat protein
LAGPYAMLAYFARSRGKPLEAEELFKKALVIDPLDGNVLFLAGMFFGSAGHVNEGLAHYEKGHEVDPLYPNLAAETAESRWVMGKYEAAIALAKTLRRNDRAPILGLIYASLGRFAESADALMELTDSKANSNSAITARFLRTLPNRPPSSGIPRLTGASGDALYIYLGAPERALTEYERRADMDYIQGFRGLVWHTSYAPVRKTDRFKTLMRKTGLVDYWRVTGWPPQCHPTTGDDFVCE